MNIISLPVGQLQANCYLLTNEDTEECLVIDPGDDADFIADEIQHRRLMPKAILATHGHFDHVMAGLDLQLMFDIPFFIDKRDQFLLDRMKETAEYFIPGIDCPPAPQKVGYFNSDFRIDNFEIEVIATAGHTPGSASFYLPKNKIVIVGDLLFAEGGVGRTDFKYANLTDLNNSIKKILNLDSNTVIYPGHGIDTTVGNERSFQTLI